MQCAQLIKVGIKWDFKQTTNRILLHCNTMSLVWMVVTQISVTMDGCGGVTEVLMSGGAPVPLPDHSSHSTDRSHRSCSRHREKMLRRARASGLRAALGRLSPRPRAARVSCVSATFLVSPPRCRRRVRGSGRGSLSSILSSFSSSLTPSQQIKA